MGAGYDYEDELQERAGNPVAHILRMAQDPLGVLRRRWIWMTLTLVLGVAATTAFIMLLEATYAAKARVLISTQQIPEDFVRSTVRENSLEQINALVGQILVRQNLMTLIERYDLYPKLRQGASRDSVISTMRANVAIESDQVVAMDGNQQRPHIYGVTFTYREPALAATIANELAALFVEASIESRSRQARYTTEFLRAELERSEKELSNVNRRISEFQRENRGELPSDLAPALAKLERLGQERESLSAQIAEREDRILVLSGVKTEGNVSPSDHQQELETLRRQLARELGVYTEEHPNVIALKRRLELLEAQASGETPVAASDGERQVRIAAEEREIARLRAQRLETEHKIAELDARVDRIPSREEELKALEQRGQVLRDNYLEFLRKVQDAELAENLESAQQGPKVSILDRAQPPGSPTTPPLPFLLAGVAATLGAAIALGVLLELLDPVILSADQLEGLVGGSLLGSLPRV